MSNGQSLKDRFYGVGVGRALRHKYYRIYTLTNFVAMMGQWLQRVGIGYLAWELTHSGFWLGAVAMAESLPLIVLVTIAGAIADRVDRLRLLRRLQIAQVLVAVVLAVLTLTDVINIYLLSLAALSNGFIQAFHLPLRMTLAPNLVPREDLTPAIGLNSAFFNSSRFLGPLIAGVIIAKASAGASFAASVVLLLVFTIGLKFVELRSFEQSAHRRSNLITEVVEGLKYVRAHTSIGPLLLLVMIGATFTRSFMDLFPGFNDEVFGQQAEGLGMLFSAVGGGGICGAFWLASQSKTAGLMRVSLLTLMITAISLLVFAATKIFWIGLASAVVAGATMSISANASQILMQNTVEGAMRGRVMSLYSLTYRAGPALGALLMGGLSIWTGLQIPVALGAGICLVALVMILPHRKRLAAEMEDDGSGGSSAGDDAAISRNGSKPA